ncbi:MAG: TetR/AcrR family transcriptional regulator [Pseudomonadota bacterium]|nr:TetR/AcrR family transcriptional regulator [Pseudomonadota bacterium]
MPTEQRKRRRSKREGLKLILEAATNEFCRAGLAGAKLDLIALEAGVSKQLIHHYFRNKAELYVAVMEEVTAVAIQQLSMPDYESLSPEEAIRMFLGGVFDLFVRWPFLAGLFNDQSVYRGKHIPECRELKQRGPELIVRIYDIFRTGQETGVFRKELEPEAAFSVAIMAVIGNFTGGKVISGFVPVDFSAPERLDFWRKFATDFSLNAMKIEPEAQMKAGAGAWSRLP